MASEEGRWYTVIWALKERTGELATKPVGRLDGGVHWTGRSAVWKVGRAMCGGRHMEQADTTPVVVAARGPATCAATGAGGERQPGRDACRVCQLEVLGAARVRVWAAASGMVRSRVVGGDRVGRRLGGAYAPLWTSLNLRYKSRPRGRRPIAGTWPVWDASWRYRYLKEPGRTPS